jgi:hypothetical protein
MYFQVIMYLKVSLLPMARQRTGVIKKTTTRKPHNNEELLKVSDKIKRSRMKEESGVFLSDTISLFEIRSGSLSNKNGTKFNESEPLIKE